MKEPAENEVTEIVLRDTDCQDTGPYELVAMWPRPKARIARIDRLSLDSLPPLLALMDEKGRLVQDEVPTFNLEVQRSVKQRFPQNRRRFARLRWVF